MEAGRHGTASGDITLSSLGVGPSKPTQWVSRHGGQALGKAAAMVGRRVSIELV
ncbi:MAG: hypothetical protein WA663_07610 [Candidatus Acidiferrales bacterium]